MGRKYAILRGKRRPRGLESTGPAAAAAVDPDKAKVDVANLSPRDVRELSREDDVAVVAPVMPTRLIQPLEAPATAAAAPAWGIGAVGADVSPFDGSGVAVAILDTGIDKAHPAFQGVTITEEDFSGSGNGDRQGHGTHCAGTVFGRDVNGTRIGVARGVTSALIGKVLGDDGSGSSDALFQAMNWALQKQARVISMSLGFDFPGLVDDLIRQGWPADLATSVALEAYRSNLRMFDEIMRMGEARVAFDGGAVVVAAAGNESRRNVQADYEIAVSIPAAAVGVVSVAALEQGAQGLGIASFSNTNAEISGPGVAVVSAKLGGGLVAFSGTSMATPHVAGVTALYWQAIKQKGIPVTARNVVSQLLANARTNTLAPNIDIADRGVGIAFSPTA
jgi:subtilisin family serine protease